jgi:hypothetical protein
MADQPVAREVGVELPAPKCPSCGEEVARVENPDGSFSGEAHDQCFKPAEKADEEQQVPVETGDDQEENRG